MPTPLLPKLRDNRRPSGEPLVWLTAMGLALGLTMVVCLLGLIISKGTAVFWPHRVVAWTIADGDGKEQVVLGEEALARERIDGKGFEYQIYLANKDAVASTFQFVDAAQVRSTGLPSGVMRLDRLQYGPAIGDPVALVAGGSRLPASDPAFAGRLQDLVAAATAQRGRIQVLERHVIGANSRDILRR